MKKFLIIVLSLFTSNLVFAQETSDQGFLGDPLQDPMLPYYVLIGFTFLVALVTLIAAIYIMQVLNLMARQMAEERARKQGIEYVPEPSRWAQFWDRFHNLRPIEEEKDIMLDHDYDGIKELDNYLPPWWKWLFYGSIIWGIGYLFVYHVSDSFPLSTEEYNIQVAEAEKARAEFLATQPPASVDESSLEYTGDADLIQAGQSIFTMNCASCHKEDGGGSIGPNLTDEYWLHGGGIKNIFQVIKNGVPEKGMISWEPVLKPTEMVEVANFIMSIQGTNPPAAKAPQGELYTPEVTEEVVQPADSTAN